MKQIGKEIEIARNESKQYTNGTITDALVVVDVQYDFIEGTLRIPNGKDLIPEINKAIMTAYDNGMLILFTRDWHPQDHCSFEGHGGSHTAHCVMGTRGAEIHPDIHIPDNK